MNLPDNLLHTPDLAILQQRLKEQGGAKHYNMPEGCRGCVNVNHRFKSGCEAWEDTEAAWSGGECPGRKMEEKWVERE
jgi:hypothetical protein